MSNPQEPQEPTPVHHEEGMPEGEEAPPPGVKVMAVVRWILILGLAAAAVFTVGDHYQLWGTPAKMEARYQCPMHPSVISDRPGECPICGMSLVPIEEVQKARRPAGAAFAFECPLHPDFGSDRVGQCPVCGETLVPGRREKPPKELTPILLSPERIQKIGVRTAPVRRKELKHQVKTVGYVTVDESRLARVQTRFAGWIEKLFVNQTGVFVRKGQALAAIYSNELYLAQVEYLHALQAVERAPSPEMREIQQSLASAARKRLVLLGISEDDIASLEKTRRAVRALVLRSPVSGHVLQKTALLGIFLQPGTELFNLADLSRVWVLADIYERDLPHVRLGQNATVKLTAYPGRSFRGRVRLIYPSVVDQTRTLKVRVELSNPRLALRPGMYAHVELGEVRRGALVAPSEAVVDTGEHAHAFVAHSDGTFEPRKVQVGLRVGDDVEVLGGLREGERVVASANFLIDSESRIRAAIEAMTTAGKKAVPPAHQH
jgi:RND family efflux transporter MFP subunit